MDPVVHFEIAAGDIEKTQAFYKEVFGWKFQSVPMPEGQSYHMIYTSPVDDEQMLLEKGRINGGMVAKEGSDPGTVVVINVPSIDTVLEKITANGGDVVFPRQQVMDMGFYARAKDCDGNVIGIWEDAKKE